MQTAEKLLAPLPDLDMASGKEIQDPIRQVMDFRCAPQGAMVDIGSGPCRKNGAISCRRAWRRTWNGPAFCRQPPESRALRERCDSEHPEDRGRARHAPARWNALAGCGPRPGY